MNFCPTLQVFQDPLLQQCFDLAAQQGARLVLVGGAVRDVLLTGILPNDWDFLVLDQDAGLLAKTMAVPLHARPVTLDDTWGIYRLVLKRVDDWLTIDLANALENDLQTDILRRDLTINAIGWDGRQFIDPTDGRRDLASQHIRMVSEQNLLDDPLRLLRVFRTASLLNTPVWDTDTLAVVRKNAPRLWQAAPERIQTEWLKLLSAEDPGPIVRMMHAEGLLAEVLLCGEQDLTPALAALQQLQIQVSALPASWRDRFAGMLMAGTPLPAWVRWVTLLQSFYTTAETAQAYWHQFRLSRQAKKQILHWQASKLSDNPKAADRAAWYRRVGDASIGALLVQTSQQPAFAEGCLVETLDAAWAYQAWADETPPLLSGTEIMEACGLPAGPVIQQLLNTVRDRQWMGQLQNQAEVLQWLMQSSEFPFNHLPG